MICLKIYLVVTFKLAKVFFIILITNDLLLYFLYFSALSFICLILQFLNHYCMRKKLILPCYGVVCGNTPALNNERRTPKAGFCFIPKSLFYVLFKSVKMQAVCLCRKRVSTKTVLSSTTTVHS